MQTVMLYGNSLVVASVGAGLAGWQNVQLVHVDPAEPGTRRKLSELHPDVVIFDLALLPPQAAIRLWKVQPHLMLVGIDLKLERMVILSDHSTCALTTAELLQAIQGQAGKAQGSSLEEEERFFV